MRLFLSLPVLVVVLLMILEGPVPAQGAPEAVDASSGLDKLKEFGNTLENKVREFFSRIKESDIPTKTRLEPFHWRAGCVWVEPWRMGQDEQIEKKISPREDDTFPLVTQLDLK
uniref:Apolipoprotein C-I n=1 Tax=Cebus imitator TaxID=2715852 RepID=A0A2K5SID6_CEBIM